MFKFGKQLSTRKKLTIALISIWALFATASVIAKLQIASLSSNMQALDRVLAVEKWQNVSAQLNQISADEKLAQNAAISGNTQAASNIFTLRIAPQLTNLLTQLSGPQKPNGQREGGLLAEQQIIKNQSQTLAQKSNELGFMSLIIISAGLLLAALLSIGAFLLLRKDLKAFEDIKASLDSANTCLMIADKDHNINYINIKLHDMFKEAENDIREELRSFDVDSLIGTNMDTFHKDPSHQRSMVEGLEGTFETSIKVGGRIFDLIANPVKDASGNRSGTVVEWEDVTIKRKDEANATRIQTSVEAVTSNVMIADENNIIVYMNPTLEGMLKEAEETIQESLPVFKVDEIIGDSFDKYHKNPDHQRSMVGNLTDTYETSITVGPLIFDLVATPITNDANERLGTVVEWQNVTESRKAEEKSTRIQRALDYTNTNVMVADETNVIIYMNEAVEEMLQNAEADIQKDLPNFEVKTIVGSSIDVFHKNPDHQRGLVKALTKPIETAIKVGGRTFELIASPIFGENEQRLGTVVEWNDVTVELAIESEINEVVEAVTAGDFARQLPTEEKEGFMLKLSEGINQIARTANGGLANTIEVLEAVSSGDLTQKMEGDYQGKFLEIQQALNNTIDQLFLTVGSIKKAANHVNTASDEISSGSRELSSRTEQQASTLEETAASMEELTSAVQKNTENSTEANKLAVNANGVAEKGGSVVNEAVDAMGKIEDSSQKISDIIGVIDDIAFQTNLLALNAAVEAARAGDAGKGFAVVASEVRTLAGRSASASKEIKTLINESASQVDSGAKLVKQAGETLKDIVSSVSQVAEIMGQIESASKEQATGIEEINSAVTQMDEATQQNAALVEENTAAAQSMVDQANELEELVSSFRIDESEENTSLEAIGQQESSQDNKVPSASDNRAAPPAKVAPKQKELSTTESKGRNENLIKSYDEGWEEF